MSNDKNIENIINRYNKLSRGEKISLFNKLENLDMREHYEPTLKKYRVQMLNIFGKYLVDRTFAAYNRRRLDRELNYLSLNNNLQVYDPIWADACFDDSKKRLRYMNETVHKTVITEL